MSVLLTKLPEWLTEWMKVHQIAVWNAATLQDFSIPRDEVKLTLPSRIFFAKQLQGS